MKIKAFLDSHRIAYRVYEHEETGDAQHLAQALHVPGSNVAKTVLLRANGGFKDFVIVLPASEQVDLKRVSKTLDEADVRLATESEIADRCPDCELGILPPFGSHICAVTLVDESLARHEDIFFQGDSHREAIRLRYSDFVQLEHPLVVSVIGQHHAAEGIS
jgi:Ala-tRNA(Pro) deacylase